MPRSGYSVFATNGYSCFWREWKRSWQANAQPHEQACGNPRAGAEYLARLRWDGFGCRYRGQARPWITARNRIICTTCCRHASVTAGTVFDGTKVPLRTWFNMAWEVAAHKSGTAALDVRRQHGIGAYVTAWMPRKSMVLPGRSLLGGIVEVDETYVGVVRRALDRSPVSLLPRWRSASGSCPAPR